MPKVEIDYSNTIIYKITCKDPNVKDLYVGHTTNFVQRKYSHKQSCSYEKSSNYECKLYKVIRNNGGWNNWTMEIVGFFNCKDHYDARMKEQEYFVLLNATLNSIEPMPKPKVIFPTKNKVKNEENYLLNCKSNFSCSVCHYYTSRKSQYERHIMTTKHKLTYDNLQYNLQNNLQKVPKSSKFVCSCGKQYLHRQSLWGHKKKCNFSEQSSENNEENITLTTEEIEEKPEEENPMNTTMILELLKQNNEFKELIIEQNKKILELVNTNSSITNNITNNNTTNNTKFNLQIFLNEKCKDAFNISDFINNIDVGFKDFENFGRIGYVGSINNILIRELKGLDVYKRPIHCSDLKREVIHVKDNDTWVKDEDKKHMKRAIKLIEHKNIKLVPGWLKANPKADDISTKKHEEYMKILDNSMGEMKDEDNERNYEKIIRNVAKEILIDKEK